MEALPTSSNYFNSTLASRTLIYVLVVHNTKISVNRYSSIGSLPGQVFEDSGNISGWKNFLIRKVLFWPILEVTWIIINLWYPGGRHCCWSIRHFCFSPADYGFLLYAFIRILLHCNSIPNNSAQFRRSMEAIFIDSESIQQNTWKHSNKIYCYRFGLHCSSVWLHS